MRRIVCSLILFLIVSGVCAQEFELSGKYGRCLFTRIEESDNWDTSGRLIGGKVGYHLKDGHSAISMSVTDILSSETTYTYEGWFLRTEGHVLMALAEYTYYIRAEPQTQLVPFIGAGFGMCQLEGDVSVDEVVVNDSRADMVYKIFGGFELAKRFVGEAGYFSGGRNGNTGIVFSLGLCLYIKD